MTPCIVSENDRCRDSVDLFLLYENAVTSNNLTEFQLKRDLSVGIASVLHYSPVTTR